MSIVLVGWSVGQWVTRIGCKVCWISQGFFPDLYDEVVHIEEQQTHHQMSCSGYEVVSSIGVMLDLVPIPISDKRHHNPIQHSTT